jgi:hypothetical protein
VARRVLTYLLLSGLTLLVALGVAAPAHAADAPTSLQIEGGDLSAPITVRDASQHDLFTRLLHQVSWMSGGAGDAMKPDPATLGSKYLLILYINDKPVQSYELYPQADGGPRAHRPTDQPQGKGGGEAWFYVSISIPELLRAAGVPLGTSTGGGTGAALDYDDPAGYVPASVSLNANPPFSLDRLVNAQRRPVLAWMGTAVAVLLLLAAAARRSRRYAG